MPLIAAAPGPPDYAVIFTSLRTDVEDGYDHITARMVELVSQTGFSRR